METEEIEISLWEVGGFTFDPSDQYDRQLLYIVLLEDEAEEAKA